MSLFKMLSMRIIAHRGDCTSFPENTLQAFNAAVDRGFLAIETDLNLTKDGHVVLFHDFHFQGLNRRVSVGEVDMLTLDAMRVEMAQSQGVKHYPLVTLEQLMCWAYKNHVFVVLELKVRSLPEVDAILERFYTFFVHYPILHILSSFSYLVVQSSFFDAQKSHFVFNNLQPLTVFPEKISGVCLHADYYNSQIVEDLQSQGHMLYVWGIETQTQFKWCQNQPFSGLIIDDLSMVYRGS